LWGSVLLERRGYWRETREILGDMFGSDLAVKFCRDLVLILSETFVEGGGGEGKEKEER
jgi:hypothetical protein